MLQARFGLPAQPFQQFNTGARSATHAKQNGKREREAGNGNPCGRYCVRSFGQIFRATSYGLDARAKQTKAPWGCAQVRVSLNLQSQTNGRREFCLITKYYKLLRRSHEAERKKLNEQAPRLQLRV